MRIRSRRTPNIKSLERDGDVAGLIAAASYSDLTPSRDGQALDGGIPVREGALRALEALGRDDAAEAVTGALADRSDRVRCAAIRVLCAWGQALPLAAAMAWLPDEGTSRDLALAALAELRDPESAPALADALVYGGGQEGLWDSELEVVTSVLEGDRQAGSLDDLLDLLVEALADGRDEVADRAEDFLLSLGDASTEALARALREGSAPDRAAWILGQVGGPAALEPLIEALQDSDFRVRTEACVALAELRDPASVEPLLRVTQDPEHAVRVASANALDRIGTVAVVVGVSALLRPMAANGLGEAAEARLLEATYAHEPPILWADETSAADDADADADDDDAEQTVRTFALDIDPD